jgi:hypothetical protein
MNFDSQYRSVVVRGWVVVTRKPRWFTKDEQSIIDRSLRNKWCYPSRSGCENLRHFVLGEGVVVQVLEHFTRRETGGWIYGVNVLYLEVRTACLSAADPLRIERKWKERMKKKRMRKAPSSDKLRQGWAHSAGRHVRRWSPSIWTSPTIGGASCHCRLIVFTRSTRY